MILRTVDFHELLIVRYAIFLGFVIEDIGVMPICALLRLILRFFRLAYEVAEPVTISYHKNPRYLARLLIV